MKVQASNQMAQPDFSAASTPTNAWIYIQTKNLITNSALDGNTGIVAA